MNKQVRNSCFIFTCLAALCTTLNAQNEGTEPIPREGIPTIIELFHEKPLVAIGESHEHQQLYDFLTELVRTEGFYTQVNDILIESGNALYQGTLDRYIFGEQIAYEDLQLVWINTTQSPVDPWGSEVYYQLLKTIRELNQRISESHQIRVIAADPPFEWSKVNTLEEYEAARGSRNTFYAQTAIEQVLQKGRKALMINGGAHYGHHNPRGTLVNQRIEKEYPNSVDVVLSTGSLGRGNEQLTARISDWSLGSMCKVKDTWIGLAPGPRRMVRPSPAPASGATPTTIARPSSGTQPARLKQDFFDYLLYFGKEELKYGKVDATIYKSDSIWKEMNRRSMVRFNNALIPDTRKSGSLRPTSYN